jgi:hypothetical protein
MRKGFRPSCFLSASLVLALAVLLTVVSRGAFAKAPAAQSSEDPESLIDELVSTANFGVVYVADGAGDGSVLNDKPAAAVKKIVNLRGGAISLLIAHLDDTRLTSARYKGGKHWSDPAGVPVGYVCLDILSQIVKDNKILFVQGRRDCDFDGMGVCIEQKYYFNPDDYSFKGELLVPQKRVLSAKHNWQQVYKTGILEFRFPSWLSRFSAAYSLTE